VGHQAYGYLCKEYGLRQYAIEGLNAESEPTPARMAEIVKFIKENDIKVIFSEKLLSQKYRMLLPLRQELGWNF